MYWKRHTFEGSVGMDYPRDPRVMHLLLKTRQSRRLRQRVFLRIDSQRAIEVGERDGLDVGTPVGRRVGVLVMTGLGVGRAVGAKHLAGSTKRHTDPEPSAYKMSP